MARRGVASNVRSPSFVFGPAGDPIVAGREPEAERMCDSGVERGRSVGAAVALGRVRDERQRRPDVDARAELIRREEASPGARIGASMSPRS